MNDVPTLCPKCEGNMVHGFVAEFMGGGGATVESWAQDAPKKAWVTGVNVPGICLPIATFRCEVCGYLESYARKEFAAK
jgi:hypothetical protein